MHLYRNPSHHSRPDFATLLGCLQQVDLSLQTDPGHERTINSTSTPGPYSDKSTPGPYIDKSTPGPYIDKSTPGPYSDKNTMDIYSDLQFKYSTLQS